MTDAELAEALDRMAEERRAWMRARSWKVARARAADFGTTAAPADAPDDRSIGGM
jgi:hypothetical protein